jgi:hypothetical protein
VRQYGGGQLLFAAFVLLCAVFSTVSYDTPLPWWLGSSFTFFNSKRFKFLWLQNRTEQNRTEYEHEYEYYSQRYSGLEFITVVDVFFGRCSRVTAQGRDMWC